jgi:hypothetical protein
VSRWQSAASLLYVFISFEISKSDERLLESYNAKREAWKSLS